MNFPNAANGVKKIFASEVMILFAAIFSLITALMTFTAFVAASNNSVMGGIAAGSGVAIFGFASLILFVAGYITNFIGIKKASADEEDFKKAFYALVIGLVAVIISVLLSENKMLSSACDIINNVAQLFVTVYVIQGIRNIAVKIGDSEVDSKGGDIFKVILCIYTLIFLSKAISIFFPTSTGTVLSVVLVIMAGFLSIVQYVLYLSYLSRAKKMFGV